MQPTVLVVEDDRQVRELYRDVLEEAGFSVRMAASGGIALGLISEHTFDAVICDHDMPGMTGPEFYAQAVQRCPQLAHRFVFVSAGYSEADLSGACPRLPKPCNFDLLLSHVRAAANPILPASPTRP